MYVSLKVNAGVSEEEFIGPNDVVAAQNISEVHSIAPAAEYCPPGHFLQWELLPPPIAGPAAALSLNLPASHRMQCDDMFNAQYPASVQTSQM